MPGKKRTRDEREIIFLGALMGLSREAVNDKLAQYKYRPVPSSSFAMVEKKYVPALKKHPELYEKWLDNPPSASGIPKD
jgi:hypothetical protein